MYDKITIVRNPIEEDYDIICEKYWNKWVAIYQPNQMLTFERGTVVAYADADEEDSIQWILQGYLDEKYGGGAVKQFIEEDMEECYVVFRDVR